LARYELNTISAEQRETARIKELQGTKTMAPANHDLSGITDHPIEPLSHGILRVFMWQWAI